MTEDARYRTRQLAGRMALSIIIIMLQIWRISPLYRLLDFEVIIQNIVSVFDLLCRNTIFTQYVAITSSYFRVRSVHQET